MITKSSFLYNPASASMAMYNIKEIDREQFLERAQRFGLSVTDAGDFFDKIKTGAEFDLQDYSALSVRLNPPDTNVLGCG